MRIRSRITIWISEITAFLFPIHVGWFGWLAGWTAQVCEAANPYNWFFSFALACSPLSPACMDWSSLFPAYVDPDSQNTDPTAAVGPAQLTKDVEVVDIGCGFGGLLVALAPLLPDTLIIGEFLCEWIQDCARSLLIFKRCRHGDTSSSSGLCQR